MSEKLNLLPCPRCGNRKRLAVEHVTVSEWRRKCNKCQFSTGSCVSKDEALAVWNSLPRRLRWTKESPTKTGFYWWRNTEFDIMATIVAVDVENRASIIIGSENVVDFTKVGGEWAGPIQEPEDVK